MTQEEYKAMEMERMAKMNAAPLANQVFKPVQVTNVPPPPRPQEPQITPQQRQPNIAQQFGQAFATAGIDKGVGMAMKALPFARGDKVPKEIHPFPEYEGMEDTPDDYMHLYDTADGRRQYRRLSGQERQDLMNTQPDDLSTPETFVYPTSEEGWDQWAKYRPDPRPMPPIIQDPMGPRRPGPLAQTTEELNKWYQDYYDIPDSINPRNIDDPYLDNIREWIHPDDPMLLAQKQGVVFDLRVLPPRLRSEYIQRLNSGMGHDEIIRLFESRAGKPRDYMQGTIQRYNEGGDVTQYEQPIDRALGTFDNLPERRIERGLIEKMGETRFFKLPLETQMSLLSSMGNSTRDIATFFRLKKMAPELSTMQLGYDEQKRLDDLTRSGDFREGPVKGMQMGGDVTYAETGRLVNARAPLAKPSAIDKGTPGLTHPRGTTHGEYWGRPSIWQKYKSGAYPYTIPSMLKRRVDAHNQAAYKANLKDGDQGIIFRGGGGSTDNETNWEYAQRTGDIRTPWDNVVVTPEKQGATISYKRDDIKPFTWMWNKGRNFLGFGAPLAGGSE